MEASLQNILDQTTLNWVFVGGKGGVGKTTTSCCLAIQLAKCRRNVLIVSTDPAHNLSDAFGQKFDSSPRPVSGFENLFCVEVDTQNPQMDQAETEAMEMFAGIDGGMSSIFQDLIKVIPGIDEAIAFGELMKMVKEMNYDVVVFDTAPTGHTLRLLSFPQAMETAIGKMLELKNKFAGLLGSMSAMFGAQGGPGIDKMLGKLEEMQELISKVHSQIKDPDRTTFVCVCIPEFLSIYETERLVQELSKSEIDTHNVVVNQVLFPEKDIVEIEQWFNCTRSTLPEEAVDIIKKSIARKKMQDKYIDQILELYEDFHVTQMPLLDGEVRGVPALESFSKLLLNSS